MVSTDIGIPGVFSRISLALLEDSGYSFIQYSVSIIILYILFIISDGT